MEKQYLVIYSNDLPNSAINNRTNFMNIVKIYINTNWKLEGGVSITWHDRKSEIVYAQALSKES